MKNVKQYLGLGACLAGVCFLFDPFISVFDVLPDFVGWLLVASGLSAMAGLDGRIAGSLRGFRLAALLSGVRYVMIPFIFGVTAPSEQPVGLLLCTFVLGLLDLLVLIPACRDVSGGLVTLASRHDGTAVLEVPAKRHKSRRDIRSRTDRITAVTVTFLVLKELLAVLPELAVLPNRLSGAEGSTRFSVLYEHIGLLRTLCAAAALILGILWLVSLFAYIRRVKADAPFMDSLRAAYGALLDAHPDLFLKRHVKAALVLFGIGFALCTDFFADGINILPDALAVVCWLAAVLLLRKYVRGTGWLLGGLFVYLPVATAANVWQSMILRELAELGGEDFTLVDNAARMLHDPDAAARYTAMCSLLFAAQLLLCGLFFLMRRVFAVVINRCTGLSVSGHDTGALEETHRQLLRRVDIALIIGAAASLFSAVYAWTLPYAQNTFMEVFGILDILLHAVFAVAWFMTVGRISEEIEYRYLLS